MSAPERERLAKMLYEDPPNPSYRWEGLTEMGRRDWLAIADRLLAAGVTLPPAPPEPVTSEATVRAMADARNAIPDGKSPWVWTKGADLKAYEVDAYRVCVDACIDRIAKDHGLFSEAEIRAALQLPVGLGFSKWWADEVIRTLRTSRGPA